ncbi:MAG: tripartite tricarboxylate transporter TctB family protein [Rhodoferax sp.]|uniref:tripartite tricarboxylate transporter TctB family protein n=1 Tax=Rhodoferax sp. TaxID=50421 RepID=UPI001B439B34|nr:tripartite tricarboxylate transporter TctB family protein [Rhodoferax sp.]MBP9904686.1 tripartite tricarboxylate transporter TctB family protein [Rhodoferax sp.]
MSDRILGAVCMVVGAGMAWAARGYVAPISYEPVGPSSFPLLMAGLLATAGAWLVVRPGPHQFAMPRSHLLPFGLSVAAVFTYAGLFQLLGFTLATTVMALPVGMAFGGGWKKSLAGGVGLGLVLYLLFDKLLDVVLPTGVLSFIFGGR